MTKLICIKDYKHNKYIAIIKKYSYVYLKEIKDGRTTILFDIGNNYKSILQISNKEFNKHFLSIE